MIDPKELEELLMLLPFYVNGRLDIAEQPRMEAALAKSPELREALAQERALKERVVAGMNAAVDPSAHSAAAREAVLNARASAASRPVTAMESTPPQSLGLARALAFLNPRRWHPALALGLAFALPAQAALLASQSAQIAKLEDENFQLASGPCEDRQNANQLLIEVKEETPYSALSQLLASEGLVIIKSGDFGLLTLRSNKTGAERAAMLARLKKANILTSAEPAA